MSLKEKDEDLNSQLSLGIQLKPHLLLIDTIELVFAGGSLPENLLEYVPCKDGGR